MIRKKKRLTIGLLIDFIPSSHESDMFQTRILSEVHRSAKEHDFNLICFVSGRVGSPFDWDRSRNVLFDLVQKSRIDGLLVSPSVSVYNNSQTIPDFLKRFDGIPLVLFNDHSADSSCVTVDNHSSMMQIIDHLIKMHGCRRIAFIKGYEKNSDAIERYEAYLASLEKHDIPFDPDLIHPGNFLFDSGSSAVKSYLEKEVVFDAIVAANDNMAIGAIQELRKHSGKLPGNLPVTGFDDTVNCCQYNLTSVRQSFEEIANTAVMLLLQNIQNGSAPIEIEIPAKIVYRTSCGCISPIVARALEPSVCPAKIGADPCVVLKQGILDAASSLAPLLTVESYEIRRQLQNSLQKLADSLADGINSQNNSFLNNLDELLSWASIQRMDLSRIHDFLSSLRKYSYLAFHQLDQLVRAEALIQTGRIQIGEAVRRESILEGRQSELQISNLYLLGEELVSSLDLMKQMKALNDYLPRLDFPQCFIALYDEPEKPLTHAWLIQGFLRGQCLDLSSQGRRFQTLDILPTDIIKDLQRDRFSLVIQALHHGENQLGYVALGIDTTVDYNLEIIRYRLSIALKSSILLKRIRNQTEELEQQVTARTQDLSRINRQLLKEISKRTKAEGQLKRTLKKMEGYNQELHHRSIRDELTGLYNRRGFMDLGALAYAQACQRDKGILLLYADLDDFKQINDRFGHPEGDQALMATAEILGQFFRSDDIVARLGGDEFTVLIPAIPTDDATNILVRLKEGFRRYNEDNKKPYLLSISIGSAYHEPSAFLSFESLMQSADESLYAEKQKKKCGSSLSDLKKTMNGSEKNRG